MGILDRVSSVLRANINSLLDEAENPELVLDQLIRDMRGAINEARGSVGEMIAHEKLLQADYDRDMKLAEEWGAKAEQAMRRGADDLAKEALRRKIDYDKNAQAYGSQLQAQKEVVAKLKQDLERLESKYEGAVRNREALISRHKRAQAQQRVAKTSAQMDTFDPGNELSRMEERIRLEEARASASMEMADRGSTLEDRFDELEADDELTQQLEDLRGKVKGQLPAGKASEA